MTNTAEIVLVTELVKGIREDVQGVRKELAAERENANESRQRVYRKLEELQKNQIDQGNRLGKVEKSVEAEKPTWQEYREAKLRVQGAGKLGMFLWRIGWWLLAGAVTLAGWGYSAREQIAAVWHRVWG